MSTYDWPPERIFLPDSFEWGMAERIPFAESPFTGAITTGEVPFSTRYVVVMSWPGHADYRVLQQRLGWLAKIGGANSVRIPNMMHRTPAGTLRGSPVVASLTAQGANQITLTTATSGETVVRGDLVGLTTSNGLQVVTVTDDATGTGTALTFSFHGRLRGSVAAGSAAVWNAPTPTFKQRETRWSGGIRPGEVQPLVVEFVEVW